jgi:outer membrane protein OmpA-like peptidoglycan-associated protein
MFCDRRASRVCFVSAAAAQERLAPTAHLISFPASVTEPQATDDDRIRSVSAVLRESDGEFPEVIFVTEGHSEDSGPSDSNGILGLRRAIATHQKSIRLRVPAAQLRTATFGEGKPICTGTDRSCRQRNRWVEVRVPVRAIGWTQ